MPIRNFRPGDEAAQVEVYNAAAAGLPAFTPANPDDVRRRFAARDFDPATRFYAEEGGRVVGYAAFHRDGRVNFPWCLPGHERHADDLFAAVLTALSGHGVRTAYAAYRADWTAVAGFFEAHGFRRAREHVNFVLDLTETPTQASRPSYPVTELRPADIPLLPAMAPGLLRLEGAELEKFLLNNPYFGPEAVFVMRNRSDDAPVAVGLVVNDARYGDPRQGDPNMPCFRLGAFGNEGRSVKKVNGLFSFLVRPDRPLAPLALDLMSHAVQMLDDSDARSIAAQVPSDRPHLLRFCQQYFTRQGSFPVFERDLTA